MNVKKLVLVVCLMSVCANIFAQTFIKKELQTEKNGYKWYRYLYRNGSRDCIEARDLDGNIIIPKTCNLLYIRYVGGIFECTDMDGIYHLYDKKGNCIIPKSKGYNHVATGLEDIVCAIRDKDGKFILVHRYTLDGKYIDAYDDETLVFLNEEIVSSSKSSSSISNSNMTSSSDGLLYKGEYTIDHTGYLISGSGPQTMEGLGIGTVVSDISIYEDKINCLLGNGKFIKINDKGERVYEGMSGNGYSQYYYVDRNYNVRCIQTYSSYMFDQYSSATYNFPIRKGRTGTQSNSSSSSSYPVTTYPQNNQNQQNNGNSTNKKQWRYYTEEVTCGTCHGTKTCNACSGKGTVSRLGMGSNANGSRCTVCGGNGRCNTCGGRGTITRQRSTYE